MEAVAANTVPPIEMIRNSIKVSVLGNRMVERSVEHRHLRNVLAEKISRTARMPLMLLGLCRGARSMQSSIALQHLVVNQGRLGEHLAAVHHAMPNRVNVGRAPNLRHSRFVGGDVANQVVQRRRNVPQRSRELRFASSPVGM